MVVLILLVFAFVLAVVAGMWAAEPWRWRMLCFALACYFLADLVRGAGLHPLS
jgi:hypothetical protein